jgi:hypothetical protein
VNKEDFHFDTWFKKNSLLRMVFLLCGNSNASFYHWVSSGEIVLTLGPLLIDNYIKPRLLFMCVCDSYGIFCCFFYNRMLRKGAALC